MPVKPIKTLLICLLSASVSFAQKDLIVKTDGNKAYLSHIVGPQENYYRIGRIYNISPQIFVPYNNLKLETPIQQGKAIRIPLVEENFSTQKTNNKNEVFIPLYYVVQQSEGLYRIGKYVGISADELKKLNKLKTESINIGDKLLLGYLKVLKDQSPLASQAKPETKKPEATPTREEKPVVKQEIPKSNEEKNTINLSKEDFKEGVFKNEYLSQTNNGKNVQSIEPVCGVFKSTSGWRNGKYYVLMNNVARGTIVKITIGEKVIYAKVLDAVPDIKENKGIDVLISNAAAAQLYINEQKFTATVKYSK
ncbi:MAG TPA: LysM peptidoglycan-binding domain-containing protein [Chitinophagaceae bacterium]|nr:LysM peptidoglycan-binding domain-containing protein [Chitinophagaceae bacterium]